MTRFARITGTGSCLPPQRLTNADMVQRLASGGVETSDEWIVERTGIRQRHIAADGEYTSDLAIAAGHYDILRHPDWLASLGRRLTDDLTVAG